MKKYDDGVLERAEVFDLDPDMVKKLYNGDPEKLTYLWVKKGAVNYRTFQKLIRYIVEA